jgi:hypothetical protein
MTDRQRITVWVQRFKDRPALMLQWYDPETGRRRSKSAETVDPDIAEAKRDDLEYELNHGKYEEPSKIPWEDFRELFAAEYLAGHRPTTREKHHAVLDVFEDIIHPQKLGKIGERTISLFVKGMRERKLKNGRIGLAPITIKNYLIALKTALRWAAEQHLISYVPKFPKVKVPKKKPMPIPAEAFEKLLDKAPDDLWRAFLLCGWWSGLRLSEASHLRWVPSEVVPWVDFEGNRIVLPAAFVKSGEDQYVPCTPSSAKRWRRCRGPARRAAMSSRSSPAMAAGCPATASPTASWPSPSGRASSCPCIGCERALAVAWPSSWARARPPCCIRSCGIRPCRSRWTITRAWTMCFRKPLRN